MESKNEKRCVDCQAAAKLKARGLCSPCYERHRLDGSLEKYPATFPNKSYGPQKATTKKEGVCAECGHTRVIAARGVCTQCWKKLKVLGTLDEKHPTDGAKRDCLYLLDFNRCPDILDSVKKRAEANFRPVDMQILYELAQNRNQAGY